MVVCILSNLCFNSLGFCGFFAFSSQIFFFCISVVEHAFQLGNGSQRHALLLELYSTELQLFKDLTTTNEGR